MGRLVACPLPCNCDKHQDSDSHKSEISHISDSSSSNSNSSQLSLPSIPSLEAASASAAAAKYECVATLKGHSSYVFSLALDGKHLYSGASNGEIRAWERNSHGCAGVSQSPSAAKSMAVLGGRLVTAHADHRIRVWRARDGDGLKLKLKLAATLPSAGERCLRLFSPGSYVEVRRHRRRTWVHHVDAVSALAVSADGAFLYSVSWDRSIKVWRSADFRCVESLQAAHDDAINAVAAAVDGTVYTGSADKLIKAWRRRDGERRHSLVATLERHKSAVNALALSTDGSVLYSGACDRSIIVWEKGGGGGGMAVAGALRGHKKAILCLAVVAQSELLCSGSADKTVRVWRRGRGAANTYSCLALFQGHNSPVKCLTASLDPTPTKIIQNHFGNTFFVYSGALDFDIKVWKIWVPS